ncbi:MAG: DUF6457 domain-containing protein [Acidimicrobiales bacterium]
MVQTEQWVRLLAEDFGTAVPSEDETGRLLGLAGVAAHASERTAAPISCWLAARAGISPAEALRRSEALAARLAVEGGTPGDPSGAAR